jgi:GAF domain-containing protein
VSRSEIVVPVIRDGTVVGVLDADSLQYDEFDETDRRFLEKVVALIPFT